MTGPRLEPGYAFVLADQAPSQAFLCKDEYWEIEIVDDVGSFRHLGTRTVDGTRVNVFIRGEGAPGAVVVAQTKFGRAQGRFLGSARKTG